VVRNEDLQQQRQRDEQRRHQVAAQTADQFGHLAHRRDVCSNVQRIGDQQ